GAVRATVERSRHPAVPCDIWDLQEPLILAPFRWIDRNRYRQGMPWHSEFPLALRGLELGLRLVNSVATTLGLGATRDVARPPDSKVPVPDLEAIGGVLDDLIAALERGDRQAVRRAFAPNAVVTIGLEHGPVLDFLKHLTRKVQVTVDTIGRRYQRGRRVHVVMEVRVADAGAPHRYVSGHVHVVMARRERAQGRGERWEIVSLRYRRAGAPAQHETGWRSTDVTSRRAAPGGPPRPPRP